MRRSTLVGVIFVFALTASAVEDTQVCRQWNTPNLPPEARIIYVEGDAVGSFEIKNAAGEVEIEGYLCGPDRTALPNRSFTLLRYTGKVPAYEERFNPHRVDVDSGALKGQARLIEVDENGKFRASGLAKGTYAVIVDKEYFRRNQIIIFDFRVLPDAKTSSTSH